MNSRNQRLELHTPSLRARSAICKLWDMVFLSDNEEFKDVGDLLFLLFSLREVQGLRFVLTVLCDLN